FALLSALGFERIEGVDVAPGIDNAPGRGGRMGHLEIGRDAQNALSVVDSMNGRSGVGLRALEHGRSVRSVVGRGRRAGRKQQGGERESECKASRILHRVFSFLIGFSTAVRSRWRARRDRGSQMPFETRTARSRL